MNTAPRPLLPMIGGDALRDSVRKTAIVAGVERSVGHAIAQRLARDGFGVVFSYVRHTAEAARVVAAIESAGSRALAVRADLTREADVARLFDAAERAFGRIDVLVIGAGGTEQDPVTDDDILFDRYFGARLRGSLYALREAVMRLRDGVRVVHLFDDEVSSAPPCDAYLSPRAAVERLTRAFTREPGGRGLIVNAVLPGRVDARTMVEDDGDGVRSARTAKPQLEAIVDAVAALAGPGAGRLDGRLIDVGNSAACCSVGETA